MPPAGREPLSGAGSAAFLTPSQPSSRPLSESGIGIRP